MSTADATTSTLAVAPPGELEPDRLEQTQVELASGAQSDDAMELEDDEFARQVPEIVADQYTLAFHSVLSCLLCPVTTICMPACCTEVEENEEQVLLSWGNYVGTVKEPGCYCVSPIGLETKLVSTRQKVADLKTVKVADRKGNPLEISAVVTYRIQDSRKAALDVTDADDYIESRATAVMKRTTSQYAYDELRSESADISRQMVESLQARVRATGARIIGFELTDLSYTPELAESLLKVQQARALISARKLIVEGAVEISREAIYKVEHEQGIKLSPEQRTRMLDHLMVIVASGTAAQPGGHVQANQSSGPDMDTIVKKMGEEVASAIIKAFATDD